MDTRDRLEGLVLNIAIDSTRHLSLFGNETTEASCNGRVISKLITD